jgi:hypothetical protein
LVAAKAAPSSLRFTTPAACPLLGSAIESLGVVNSPKRLTWAFINDENELRCGWRVLIFAIVAMLCAFVLASIAVAATSVLSLSGVWVDQSNSRDVLGAASVTRNLADLLVSLTSALAASAFCARLLEGRSFGSVGFGLHKGWWRDFGLGLVLGAVTLSMGVLIGAVFGGLSLNLQTTGALAVVRNFAVLSLFFLLAGAFEEALVRGFAFQAFAHNLGPVAALLITSVAFGLLHIRNPGVTPLSTVNTVLAGVWLGVAYLKTRSLWLATGLHASWNLAMVFLFGLPVSGITTFRDLAWFRGEPGSPALLTGGSYGLEGGLAATASLILSTLVVWKSGWFATSDEMRAAIKHGSR